MQPMTDILVLTPPGTPDASLAIAAVRAGAVGLLDLGASRPVAGWASVIERLRHAVGDSENWGLAWDLLESSGRTCGQLAPIVKEQRTTNREQERGSREQGTGRREKGTSSANRPLSPAPCPPPPPPRPLKGGCVPWLLLAGVDFEGHDLEAVVRSGRDVARSVIVEACSVDEARMAQQAGFDGVVLKGQESGGRIGRQSTFLLLQRARDQLAIPYWARGGISPHTAAAAVLAGAAGVVLCEQLWLVRESPWARDQRRRWEHLDGSETITLGEPARAYRFFARQNRATLDELVKREEAGQPWLDLLRQARSAGEEGTDGSTTEDTEEHGGSGERTDRFATKDTAEHGENHVNSPLRRRTSASFGVDSAGPFATHDSPLATANSFLPMGQEIAFATRLARRYVTTGGVVAAFRREIRENLARAARQRALDEGAPLAVAHRARYPIVQGPMTRVSDVVPFADAVSAAGALPMFALALLRKPQLEKMLAEAKARLGDRPWGVGLLGFVPQALRSEQLEVISRVRPPFAVIAGGRPSQAAELEALGISAYLHVPSPGLLEAFISDGARKFVLEGRECGGHVGPRSSFTLWSSAIDVLLNAAANDGRRAAGRNRGECRVDRGAPRNAGSHASALPPHSSIDPSEFQILFAGGIHDRYSAAMVAAAAAPLVDRGVKIGVVVGTGYLFTEEAVRTGAITPEFQRQALACRQTTLLHSGLGHASRCAETPFAQQFRERRKELAAAGIAADEMRLELEMLNLGRLRLAAKGLQRQEGESARRRWSSQAAGGELGAGHSGLGTVGPNRDPLAPSPEPPAPSRAPLVEVSEDEQRRDGMFMIGEAATLVDRTMSMADLHHDVCRGAAEWLDARSDRIHAVLRGVDPMNRVASGGRGEPLAIVGIGCLFPECEDLTRYWHNILAGFSAVREVPKDRWDADVLYSEDRFAADRIYSKWGAFLGEVRFDVSKYRIPPAVLKHVEPIQLLSLEVARRALLDAGYFPDLGTRGSGLGASGAHAGSPNSPSPSPQSPILRDFPRDRTSVIFGTSGPHEMGMAYGLRTMLRQRLGQTDEVPEEVGRQVLRSMERELPKWTEDSFAGFLNNVVAGRISNLLDLGGPNFVVDAACASSLAAVHVAAEQLRAGTCDVALVGGADATNNACGFMSFAATYALSPRGKSCPFDEKADGIVLGEGVAAIVLKRLADAERDGDSIYAVLRGIGTGSDGRNRSLTAPHAPGQLRTLRRAYAEAGVSPARVSLIEGHGTGTTVGDRVEVEALETLFGTSDTRPAQCAIGSVKSMIGHTKTAAGIAGLIKAALALKQKVLPPTANVERPNLGADSARGPLYVNTETRPWIRSDGESPRCAGVSAFGFGGTNFHVVLEEYTGEYYPGLRLDLAPRAAEVFLFTAVDPARLVERLRALEGQLEQTPDVGLAQLAYSVLVDNRLSVKSERSTCRLAIVATDLADLRKKLRLAISKLSAHTPPGGQTIGEGRGGREERRWQTKPTPHPSPPANLHDPRGVYYEACQRYTRGEVAFVIPGQGAQQLHMLKDLLLLYPQGTAIFERADTLLEWDRPLSSYIYPVPVFSDEERARQKAELDETRIAQPALSAVGLFGLWLLRRFNLRPDFVAGHSHGEYVALAAAGCLSADDLVRLSARRGEAVSETCRSNPGGMAVVFADQKTTETALRELDIHAEVANLNTPNNTTIAGPTAWIDRAVEELPRRALKVRRIPVTAAFHTVGLQPAADRLASALEETEFHAPQIPVYSNVTAEPYPPSEAAIRQLLAGQLVRPVRFVEQIDAMYQAGARVFIEVGPGNTVTPFVSRILEGKPHHAIPIAVRGREGGLQLAHLLARCATLGLPVDLEPWFAERRLKEASTAEYLAEAKADGEIKATDWIISGNRARPALSVAKKHGNQAEADPLPSPPGRADAKDRPSARRVTTTPEGRQEPPAPPESHASRIRPFALSRGSTTMNTTDNHPPPPPGLPPRRGSPDPAGAKPGVERSGDLPQHGAPGGNGSNGRPKDSFLFRPAGNNGKVTSSTSPESGSAPPSRAPVEARSPLPPRPGKLPVPAAAVPIPSVVLPGQEFGAGTSGQEIGTSGMVGASSSLQPQAPGPQPPAPVGQAAPQPISADALAQFQANMREWLELQRQMQETSRRFLDLQEQVLRLTSGEGGCVAGATRSGAPGGESLAASLGARGSLPAPEAIRADQPPMAPDAQAPATPPQPAAPAGPPPGAQASGVLRAEATVVPVLLPPGTSAVYRAQDLARGASTRSLETLRWRSAESLQPVVEPSDSESALIQVPTTEAFRQDLLEAASERTGYPIEMLEEELLLEADLGIDSIKRIEIFNGLKKYYIFTQYKDRSEEEILNAFTSLKTLGDIVEAYDRERADYLALTADETDGTAEAGAAGETRESPDGLLTPRPSSLAPPPVGPGPSRPMSDEEAPRPFEWAVPDARSGPMSSPAPEPSTLTRRTAVERFLVRPKKAPLPVDDEPSPLVGAGQTILVLGGVPAWEPDWTAALAGTGNFGISGIRDLGNAPTGKRGVEIREGSVESGERGEAPERRSPDFSHNSSLLAPHPSPPICHVTSGEKALRLAPDRYQVDYSSAESVAQLHALLQEAGIRVGAILNLLPLDESLSTGWLTAERSGAAVGDFLAASLGAGGSLPAPEGKRADKPPMAPDAQPPGAPHQPPSPAAHRDVRNDRIHAVAEDLEPINRATTSALRLFECMLNVAREFEEELRASAGEEGGRLFNVTALGGTFGLEMRGSGSGTRDRGPGAAGSRDGTSTPTSSSPVTPYPSRLSHYPSPPALHLPPAGAISLGFFKSLDHEWPEVRMKNIDLDLTVRQPQLQAALVAEMLSGDDAREVGLSRDGRHTIELVEAPLAGDTAEPLELGREAVVLVTGGARGITAEIAKGLARRSGCRLVLVGRTPEPSAEPPQLKPHADERALRAHLIAESAQAGKRPTPAEIDRQIRRILKDREIRENLAELRTLACAVEYHAIDVRNAGALARLVDQVYQWHGRIDGVVHGAGVIEDKRVRDKTRESAARVIQTKVDGAAVLAAGLRPETLRFFFLFSSVAGRFGNAGQADYAAANEYLSKLAVQLDAQWPGRVVTIQWGPWDRGVVDPGMRRLFAARNVPVIRSCDGVEAFLRELGAGDRHAAEVVLASGVRRLQALGTKANLSEAIGAS